MANSKVSFGRATRESGMLHFSTRERHGLWAEYKEKFKKKHRAFLKGGKAIGTVPSPTVAEWCWDRRLVDPKNQREQKESKVSISSQTLFNFQFFRKVTR